MIFGSSDSKLSARITELEAENKKLRDALQFYADPKMWTGSHKYRDADEATIFEDTGTNSAAQDMGSKALKALKG